MGKDGGKEALTLVSTSMKYDPNKPYNQLPLLPPRKDLETKAILKKAIAAGRALPNSKV